jgi:hypothetical protein
MGRIIEADGGAVAIARGQHENTVEVGPLFKSIEH